MLLSYINQLTPNRPVFLSKVLCLSLLLFFYVLPQGTAKGATGAINSPTVGLNVSGIVNINGDATGEQYFLDYGVGDTPTIWQPIGANPYLGPATGSLGNWDTRSLGNGKYTLRLTVKDIVVPDQVIYTVAVKVTNPRPKVIDKFPADNSTGAPSDVNISVTFDKDIDQATLNNANFYLKSGVNTVNGTINYDNVQKKATLSVTGLSLHTTYEITLTNGITDTLGFKLVPLKWNFTTKAADGQNDPHGGFANNVNTCANCHGMHVSSEGKLVNMSILGAAVNIEMYCNSCHDGTVATPRGTNYEKSNKHSFPVINNVPQEVSCNGCHNPHLPPSWADGTPNTVDNFNLLKTFYFYDHENNTPHDNTIPNSSEIELCENCHDASVVNIATRFKIYNYNRSADSKGNADDYSLCFRCHKSNGTAQSNIEQFYKDGATGHYIKSDGASKPIGWKMPCADCHDQHGSNNQRLIKEILGDENPNNISVPGNTKTPLSPAQQRTVCQGCHNNTTEMYGLLITLPGGVAGHLPANNQSCTDCHGSSADEGAHAPK